MGYFRNTIERMAVYTPGFQPRSQDVIKLNSNENPWPASPKVFEAIAKLNPLDLQRYPQSASDTFRMAASAVLAVKPENIICTNGGDDLLTICFRAFCDAERPVAYAQPTYSMFPVLASLQGCDSIEIERDRDGSLKGLVKADAALTIVCNPNAPTCDFIAIEKLADLAGKLSGVLLIDEAYVDFAEDNAIRLINDFDNVIILRSMSKGYSLAGIRFGYGIAASSLINGLMNVKDFYNVDAVAIAAATAAIQDQPHLTENVQKIIHERTRVTEQLLLMGFEVNNSQTNFILAQSSQKNAKDIHERLTRQNIYIRYFELPGLRDKLRITIGMPQQNDRLLAALSEIIG
ncbi:MAG: histidinol-phosphate transaminase [Gammaproteobacteria bacterium]|nr:MAG: histidinol-phosphate transaminase [Gammaproteobacteria bacterium]